MRFSYLTIIFIYIVGCSESEVYTKAKKIKGYAIEKKIYCDNLIYFKQHTGSNAITLPNLKAFNRYGQAIQTGDCMNALENILRKILTDSLKQIELNEINFQTFIDSNGIVSVDDLKKPKVNIEYNFYVCYHWNYALEQMTSKEDADIIFQSMRKASIFAKQNKIKLLYIHN